MVTFFKGDEPNVDLGISYALSRRVFSCPGTSSVFESPYKPRLSAAADYRLYLQAENFVPTTGCTFQ
jgi:hypothetical protein